jgi:hypothetical protein
VNGVKIVTAASSATAPDETRGNVLVSGSYGGIYNAWHALRRGARAVILNDAGVGKNGAGVSGLAWLDSLGIASAATDCWSCHIGDGQHMLAHGRIGHVNEHAAALGCAIWQTAADCAECMKAARPLDVELPEISGGKRFVISDRPGERRVLGLDAAPLLQPGDAGAIAVTGSHAALFRGRPDNVINVDLFAVFFNDAGVGVDNAGILRLTDLESRGVIAATVSAESAEIGSARSSYDDGIVSHSNAIALAAGIEPGARLRLVVGHLAMAAKEAGSA